MNNEDISALSPARILVFTLAFAAAVTEDLLNQVQHQLGWSIDFLKWKARDLGIAIEPSERETA